jgi:hypothetical protein
MSRLRSVLLFRRELNCNWPKTRMRNKSLGGRDLGYALCESRQWGGWLLKWDQASARANSFDLQQDLPDIEMRH